MKGVAKKARNYCLTQNDLDRLGETLEYLRSLNPNYLLCGREKAPTTGHVHGQMYVQFPTPRALSIKKLAGAHIEKARASPEQNIAYCKKEGDIIVEEGKPRLNYAPSIKAIKQMKPEQREELAPNLYNIVNKINEEEKKYINPADYFKQMNVYFVYGPSGIGKTKWCIDKMIQDKVDKFNEVKYMNGFWNGVTEDCQVCLYDDWRDSHMKPAEFINFIDYNKHIMNVKGGSIRNNYTTIYITSTQSPQSIYPQSREEKIQWIRRIHCIDLNPEEGEHEGGIPPSCGIGQDGGVQEGSVEASSK